ncbi:MAG: GntR family transcriptional regulator [Clostridia bacterium]|nr:GntR family transcriptional regulator [Clostridia bacterium]
MFVIDAYSRVPVYQQIVDGIRKEIFFRILPPGSQVYSVRELSGELRANPNTVQKAYNELIRQGLIVSVPGKGNYIGTDAWEKLRDETARQEQVSLQESAHTLCRLGIPEETVLGWVRETYQKGGDSSS